MAELRQAHHRSTLFTFCAVTMVWLFFAGLDVWRLHQIAVPADVKTFFIRSVIPRVLVTLCLGISIWMMRTHRASQSTYDVCVVGCVLSCCISIASSSYTLRNLQMQETSVVMVLIVVVALYPLGVRLRLMAPVALICCLLISLAGPTLLERQEDMLAHWVLSAVLWIGLVLSGVNAYLRERSMREQFLLRRLLQWEASHDPLTHLPNRRMFHEHLERTMRQARREGQPLFLAIVDVDHFKRYNDHYGHQAGDTILVELAKVLTQYTQRPLDLAVRLGGEEFGLIFYGMSGIQVQQHLMRLNQHLQQRQMPHAASPTALYVTVSIGATNIRQDDTQDSAFQRADQWLYLAKSQGRNRACMQWSEETCAPDGSDASHATTASRATGTCALPPSA